MAKLDLGIMQAVPRIEPRESNECNAFMNADWKRQLDDAGAVLDETGRVLHFADPASELQSADGLVLADLSHLAVIAVRGEDAASFLQGQFSNDIQKVDAGHSQLAAWCNPKGRMLAALRIFHRENAFYLLLEHSLLEPTLKRLRMYVLRSKVTLEDAGEDLPGFGLSGPEAEARLAELLGSAPAVPGDALEREAVTVLRLPGPHPRFSLHAPAATLGPLWSRLREGGARPVGAHVWALQDIRAGQPSIHPGTQEAFVPQMVNLEVIGGVSFKKGCYTGQEVVARMHYLGKPKRRMFRARAETDSVPPPGTEILAAGAEQSAGKVVDAQPAPEGGVELLAVLQLSAVEGGAALHLGGAQGPQLTLLSLPYALEQD